VFDPESAQHRRKHRQQRGVVETDAQAAGFSPRGSLRIDGGRGELLVDATRPGQQSLAGRGGKHALSGAIKQPGADLAFQLSDGLGQRRLSDADRRGRPAEMLVFCQCQGVPELPDIHTTTISKRYGRDPITVWPLSACRRAR